MEGIDYAVSVFNGREWPIVDSTYQQLKQEWRQLWEQKIDDEWRAEAIARREYAALFVDMGDVIWATRCFKPFKLQEVLERHERESGKKIRPIDPRVGGWGKFIREEVQESRRERRTEDKNMKGRATNNSAHKKGGRGWLHNV
ncbi:hypothetical protein MUP77_20080 [Candidatus Bathyarchaeota archaeon]|nr:hypothetical protein [Candidatus Bathyarchaeota archaeon]